MFSEFEYTKNPSLEYAKETFVDFIWKKNTHTQKEKKKNRKKRDRRAYMRRQT